MSSFSWSDLDHNKTGSNGNCMWLCCADFVSDLQKENKNERVSQRLFRLQS